MRPSYESPEDLEESKPSGFFVFGIGAVWFPAASFEIWGHTPISTDFHYSFISRPWLEGQE